MQEQEKMYCISCKEEINYSNTRTKEGWREVNISGMCEKCFDNCTVELPEYEIATEIIGALGQGVVLAGGSLRFLVDPDDYPNDYDLFFTDISKVEATKEYFVSKGYDLIFQCHKNELSTYFNKESKTKVQLIQKREYKDCLDLINSFDITACCCAYDGKQFYQNDRFVFDNLHKLINLNKVEYPVATMKRISKYSSYGFKLTSNAARFFVENVNTMQLTDENLALYID